MPISHASARERTRQSDGPPTRAASCLASVVLCLTLCAAAAAQSATAYMEREYKLDVPPECVDEVWAYLHQRYGHTEPFPEDPGRFQARFSEEWFIDRYFDTPELQLLHAAGGIRHRTRLVPDNPRDPRHGRQRLHIKLDRPDGQGMMNRTEVTFRRFRQGSSKVMLQDDDLHPLMSLLHRDERPAFRRLMHQLDVDPEQLAHTLTLQQRRRRMYLTEAGVLVAQASLDEVTTRKWWHQADYALIELALDEMVYSQASPQARVEMERMLDAIQADLIARFPALTVDLTPKYNRSFAMLDQRYWRFSSALRYDMPMEAAAGGGVLLIMLGCYAVVRRARQSRSPAKITAGGDDHTAKYFASG